MQEDWLLVTEVAVRSVYVASLWEYDGKVKFSYCQALLPAGTLNWDSSIIHLYPKPPWKKNLLFFYLWVVIITFATGESTNEIQLLGLGNHKPSSSHYQVPLVSSKAILCLVRRVLDTIKSNLRLWAFGLSINWFMYAFGVFLNSVTRCMLSGRLIVKFQGAHW